MLERALEIPGWIPESEMEWLVNQAKDCATILEIGPLAGRTTRALADNTKATIHVVDPWSDALYSLVEQASTRCVQVRSLLRS